MMWFVVVSVSALVRPVNRSIVSAVGSISEAQSDEQDVERANPAALNPKICHQLLHLFLLLPLLLLLLLLLSSTESRLRQRGRDNGTATGHSRRRMSSYINRFTC
jgi:hypothetical protein